MKAILAVAFTLLVGLIFTAIAEIPDVHHDSDGLPDGIAGLRLPHTKTPESETDTPPPAPPSSDDVVWNKDKCRGQALLSAMTLNEANSSRMFGWPYTQSPWDGSKLAKWGYDVDVTHEDHVWYCDFITYNMNRAFEELMINIRPSGKGGPNHCFLIQHQYGSTVKKPKDGTWPEPKDQWYEVDGVWYRVRCALEPGYHPLTNMVRKLEPSHAWASMCLMVSCTSYTSCRPRKRQRNLGC
jgi:hypothetical protein